MDEVEKRTALGDLFRISTFFACLDPNGGSGDLVPPSRAEALPALAHEARGGQGGATLGRGIAVDAIISLAL